MAINLQQPIFSECADFLVSEPSLETFANYQVSTDIQQRIDYLLDKNGEGELSTQERLELEKILAVVDVMNLAKAKAMLKLAVRT